MRERELVVPQFCRVEREGPLTIVTLDRPEVLNPLHPPAHTELAEVFDVFAEDRDQWVAIITGSESGPSAPETTSSTGPPAVRCRYRIAASAALRAGSISTSP